jgi:hypothetical protein
MTSCPNSISHIRRECQSHNSDLLTKRINRHTLLKKSDIRQDAATQTAPMMLSQLPTRCVKTVVLNTTITQIDRQTKEAETIYH